MLFVSALTAESWQQFQSFFTERGSAAPQPAQHVIFCSDDDEPDRLVAGVCVYPTEGPYMFLEHFTYDPELDEREALRAMRFIGRVIKGVSAYEGKVPLVLTAIKGIANACIAEGFVQSQVTVFYALPGQPEEQKRAPSTGRSRGGGGTDEEDESDEEIVAPARPARNRRRRRRDPAPPPVPARERPGRRHAPRAGRAPLSDFEDDDEEY